MTSSSRKERDREMRRGQILDAAREVFIAKGFLGATMEEIAERADYSQATLYLYFKNKYDLYTTLAFGLLVRLAEELERLDQAPGLGPVEKLRETPRVLFEVYQEDPGTMVNLFRLQSSSGLKDLTPEMVVRLNGVSARIIRRLAGFFEDGMEAGLFRREHPVAAADTVWGLFTGLVLWEESKNFFDPGKKYLKPTLDSAVRIFLDGLSRTLA
ncbi:MAG: TetR/AcrR family transcriptional regulator [Pseudomonadota bacterium]